MTGKQVRKWRERQGWTLQTMGAWTGFHPNTIWKMENDQLAVSKRLVAFIEYKRKVDEDE